MTGFAYRNDGIHVRFNDPTWTWPTVNAGVLRLIEQHWSRIHLGSGLFDWRQMDEIMAVAANRYFVVFSLFGTPRWASSRPDECWEGQSWTCGRMAPPVSLDSLREFITALMTRYPSIEYVEGWNEPFDAPHHWTGTVDELVAIQRTLYETVKSISPKVAVLSPPCSSTSVAFKLLNEFMGKARPYFDVVAHHFYAASPAHRARDVHTVRSFMAFHGIDGMELWNTEFGFGDLTEYPPSVQVEMVAGAFNQMRQLGVRRNFFFIWNDPDSRMGIRDNQMIIDSWNSGFVG